MGFFVPLDVAASGLTAQRLRMDVTAENLANADTTRGPNGQPYQRQEVILQQVGGFGETLAGAIAGTATTTDSAPAPGGVTVAGIVSDPTLDQLVYQPGNPDANAQGYVRLPNVNSVTEMVDLIDESRSYEANVTAMQTAKSMYTKTLDLLK
jgi:flagellar basal-body rod protein FlgC